MTKIDIFSGFLGAGKTTLIKKLIKEAFAGEKLVLIENEFGEIGVDGGFMREAGIEVTEMSQGCICCSLVGDFKSALKKVIDQYAPERILIEPSGVGKLSDVIRAVRNIGVDGIELNSFTTIVDAKRAKMYMKNFGEFWTDQVEHANSIILSRTQDIDDAKLAEVVEMLRQHNADATLITTPWDELSGEIILSAMKKKNTLKAELERLASEDEDEDEHEHHHHHHHDDDDDDDDDEHEHHHHHHHDGEECDDPDCECHHHHHDDDDDD
ncbi:MAG: GTP-binding protein, partial [Clostridia bacterium]|nr:GTP-binding protein [Clostridia bacterium]